MATEVRPSAAVELTLLSKERPLAAEMKAWVEENPERSQVASGLHHRHLRRCMSATPPTSARVMTKPLHRELGVANKLV